MASLIDLLLPLGGLLAGLVLVSALALRFVSWRGKRLYQHLYHWWVVRRGTRRMLRRAERVHAGGAIVEKREPPTRGAQPTGPRADAAQSAELPQPAAWSQQPETVILPARDEGFVAAPGPTSRPDPKRARAEAEAQGLRILRDPDEPDALAGWLLNAIGLSILIILAVWLGSGGKTVVQGLLP